MKKKLSLLMVALVAVAAFAGLRRAAEPAVEITFQSTGTGSDSSNKISSIGDIVATGADFVEDITTATNVYNGREGRGVKLGTSKAIGELTLKLKEAVKPSKIVVNARKYNDKGENYICINDNEFELSENAGDDCTITYDGETEVSEIVIKTTETDKKYRAYVISIKVYVGGGGDEPTTRTATFENDGNWADVYAYAWSGEGDNVQKFLGDWPGTKLEATDDGYVVSITSDVAPEKIIFNNGDGIQTGDLAFEDGATYNSKGKVVPEPELKDFSVTFTTDAGWENVFAYAWNEDNTPLAEWPGVDITATKNGEGVYTYAFKAATAPTGIIFNNGLNGDAKQQTADLTFDNGKAYSYSTPKDVTTLDFTTVDVASVPADYVGEYGNLDNYTIADATQGVKMLIKKNEAATSSRFWNNSGALQLRIYNGATLTFEPIEEGKVIKKITFEAPNWGTENSTDVKTLTGKEWAGEAAKVVLTIAGGKTFINKITVEVGDATAPVEQTFTATFKTDRGWEKVYAYTWSGEGDSKVEQLGAWPGTEMTPADGDINNGFGITFKSATAPEKIIFNNGTAAEVKQQTADLDFVDGKTYNIINNIETLNAQEDKAEFDFAGEALIVAKPTAKYVYIKDETGASLIYDASGEKTAAAEVGKTLAANWAGAVSIYNGLFEAVPAAALAVKDGEPVEVTYPEATAVDVKAENVNQVVTIKGLTVTPGTGKNITFKLGEQEIAGYNQFDLNLTEISAEKTYDVVGAISRFKETIQFQPITIKEVTPEPDPVAEDIKITPAEGDIAAALAAATEGKKVGNITIELAAKAAYTISAPLEAPADIKIYGNEATIDASALAGPFIQMSATPAVAVNEKGGYPIDGITIKDVTITGIPYQLIQASNANYLMNQVLVDNSVIAFNGTNKKSIFDFAKNGECGANVIALTINESTIYGNPTNAQKGGFFTSQSGKEVTDLGGETTTMTITNSTLYNITKGQTLNTPRKNSQSYQYFVLKNNVFVDCGKKNEFLIGICGASSISKKDNWTVEGNLFNFEGEDTSAGEETKSTLTGTSSIAGVITFTDAANGDFNGECQLAEGAVAPEGKIGDDRWNITFKKAPVYIVAGNKEEIFGNTWDGNDANNKMTKGADGKYSKTYTVTDAVEDIQLKVVEDGTTWHGDASGNNVTFNLTGAGEFTVTIDPSTKEITVTGDNVKFPTDFDYTDVYAVGNGAENDPWMNGISWDPAAAANKMTKVSDGIFEITFNEVPAGENRKVKFAIDGTWDRNFGGTFAAFGVETDAVYNGSDITFNTTADLPKITIRLDLTGFDFATKQGAKFTISAASTTGINGVKNAAALKDAQIYTISGQRVDKAQKGLYIVNGKKVVIK